MSRRVLLVCAALAVLGTAPAAVAKTAPKPQIVDPKGDALGGTAAHDIVSVQYSTTGTGAGKKYVPKKLVVALTLAAAPDTRGAVSYTVDADVDMCGPLHIRYTPGSVVGGVIGDTYATFGSCAESTFFYAKVKGSVVSFEFGLKATGIDRGSELSSFEAKIDGSDPVLGSFGTELAKEGLLDLGTGDVTWVVP